MPKKTATARPPPLELLSKYAPLVHKIAGGFHRKVPRSVLREDLIAAGMGGLWDAIRRNAGPPGEHFEWYIRLRIRGAIIDELRATDYLPRRARVRAEEAKAAGDDLTVHPHIVVLFDDLSEWEQNRVLRESLNTESLLAEKEIADTLIALVDRLPERERTIVDRHYFHGAKLRDLGAEMGVSEPRISQLMHRALKRMRKYSTWRVTKPVPRPVQKPAAPKKKVPQRGRKKKRRG